MKKTTVCIQIALVLLLLVNKVTAVFVIGLYQQHLSPLKGWNCPYTFLHPNSLSCSAYSKNVIGKYGMIKGTELTVRRFYECDRAAFVLDSISRQISLPVSGTPPLLFNISK